METKLYKAVEGEFLEIVNNEGKYYQEDGTFSDIRTQDSIGLCIISNQKEHVIMALDCDEVEQEGDGTLDDCIPSIIELSIAYLKFKDKIEFKPGYYLTKETFWFYVPDRENEAHAFIGGVRRQTGMLLGTLRIPI